MCMSKKYSDIIPLSFYDSLFMIREKICWFEKEIEEDRKRRVEKERD